ncbi:hypothetical protein ACLOJK_038056 [Asimina triloba]
MAESAVNFLIEYMGPLLVDEVKLLKGVRGEARKIRDELESMRAFLRDADAREDSNESIKIWVRQVRAAAHDTEDILDDFIVHIGQHHQDRRGVFGFLRKIAQSIKQLKARHQIASKVQDMRSRLTEISKRKDDYNLSRTDQVSIPSNLNQEVYDHRMAALFTEDNELVGIDKPRDHLIGWLLRGEQRHSTIAVFGMGGLGKTTLVKKVYDSDQVKKHFETYAWITVSKTFKKKEVLQDMITQFYKAKKEQAPSGVDAMTDIQLIQVLRDFLQSKRFALVFDDVWELDAWKLLSLALPGHECGSRVILTMRRRDLASSCCIGPSDYVYEPQPLNPNMAWSLFCQRAFPANNDNQCPPELEQLARSLVKKCCGLPLAIVTLGGLLASKDQTYAVWDVTHRSLGTEIENDNLRSMMKILWLSFIDLPYYLKSCFLYLSVFPEDYYIGSRFIISLWIAEGFIIRKEGMTLEEVGESYLNALINRSLVQVREWERYGRMVPFRIHDLLLEIVISKSKEENLCISSSSSEESIIFPDRIRRLSIHNKGMFVPKLESSSHLRSFFIFGMIGSSTIPSVIPSFSGLRLLRVVGIENVPMEIFPEHLTSLHHLRFSYVNVIVESDSKIVVDWFQAGKCTLWYLWDFWDECIKEMQGMNVRFIHQYREGNLAADFLAKLGESGSNRIYEDIHDLPRLLRGIVRIDKSGLQAIAR